MDGLGVTPAALVDMISLIEDGTISGKIAKDVLPELLEGKGNKGEGEGQRQRRAAVKGQPSYQPPASTPNHPTFTL